jgi:hypothetical protein
MSPGANRRAGHNRVRSDGAGDKRNNIQELVDKNDELLRVDGNDPSLHFKKVGNLGALVRPADPLMYSRRDHARSAHNSPGPKGRLAPSLEVSLTEIFVGNALADVRLTNPYKRSMLGFRRNSALGIHLRLAD